MHVRRSLRINPAAIPWVTYLTLALLPTFWASGQAPTVRGIALPAMAMAALAMVAAQAAGRGPQAAGAPRLAGLAAAAWRHGGPTVPVSLLFAWAVVCAVRVGMGSDGGPSGGSVPAPWATDFARGELLRLAGGMAVYLAVAAAARHWERARWIVDALILAVVGATVMAYVTHTPEETALAGAFGNRQLLAAFLLLLAPLMVVAAIAARDPRRRTAAQAAAVLALSALALTQVRSAWLGGIVALVVLASLLVRLPRRRGRRRDSRPVLLVGVLALAAVSFLICRTDLTGSVAARARTLTRLSDDEGTVWRLRQWRVALALVGERPLWGHGLGMYPLAAAPRLPQPIPLDVARAAGPNLSLNAHNLYLQFLVETGAVGLALYGWVLVSFFAAGLRTYRRLEHRGRCLILSACLAALAGQLVDALANPAYQFVDVSFFFWAVLGLGTAMTRRPVEAPDGAGRVVRGAESASVAPRTTHAGPSGALLPISFAARPAAALTAVGVLVAGSVAGSTPPANVPTYMPLSSFRVQALTTPGYLIPTVLPGECIEMRAQATMQNGEVRDATHQCRFTRAGGTTPTDCVQQLAAPHGNLFCVPVGVPAACDGTTLELQGSFEFNGQTITARSPALTLSVPQACPGVVVTATPQVLPATGDVVDVTVHYEAPGLQFQRLQRVTANETLSPGDVEIIDPTHLRLRAVSTVANRRIYTLQYRFRDRYNRTWMGQVQVYVR